DFNSPSIFAALLDDDRGGSFSIAPTAPAKYRQSYLPDTNILVTRFLLPGAVAELSDFMPVEGPGSSSTGEGPGSHSPHHIMRHVQVVRGEIDLAIACRPRFDYARSDHRITRDSAGFIFKPTHTGVPALRLSSSVDLEVSGGDVTGTVHLKAGQSAWFVLAEVVAGAGERTWSHDAVVAAFEGTGAFWRQWIGRSTYRGRWREMVNRSAMVLKLLFSAHWGTLLAAATFGLPEEIGGVRNWDYRYTWIRDASFTLHALLRIGLGEEVVPFVGWLEKQIRSRGPTGPLQVMYGIDGTRDLTEVSLDHFSGYLGSRPVRIGNAAYQQLQLDVYGELLDALYLYGKSGQKLSHSLWMTIEGMVNWVCDNWERRGEGIWEMRGGTHEFLYSRVMCWVAIDRAMRIARDGSRPAPISRWHDVRDEIYRNVFDKFWNPRRGAFVQYPGADILDASALMMPLVKFISPTDPMWLGTLDAISTHLVEDSLVYRYRTRDSLPGQEGTFSICTFWYAQCLSQAGRVREARLVFEKMLGYANHVGLYAEQLGPCAEHLGNFPQALTHLGLISAACEINRTLERTRIA
ncbi:MAG TPA: glycoside hydrolase family 15 protein, partial [Kofleriaceae bacterium]|nr:glycoside hydrolase family 15 protein [Kofleriaceae bacterium]